MAGVDKEESTISCVDAWIEKLFDAKTLSEAEVVQLCEKVRPATFLLRLLHMPASSYSISACNSQISSA
jgi:hypothetical protein